MGPNQTTRSQGTTPPPRQACLQLSPFPRNALLLSNLNVSIFPQEMSVLYVDAQKGRLAMMGKCVLGSPVPIYKKTV